MDWIPGFAWPVPRAFAAAVSAARFEQGDVFYDDACAYGEWPAEGTPGFRFRVQVLDPPRSTRAAPSDAEGTRFAASWGSPVTCEISDYEARARSQVRTSQGRLFTCLWRGQRELLREVEPGHAELPLPAVARDLQKHLEGCLPALRRASKRKRGSWFVSVVDQASESSLAKARDVESALAAGGGVEVADLSPVEAGVPDGDAYHPALRVRGLRVDETRGETLREILKHALYGPARADGETPDRFKLERHGLLVAADDAKD